MKSPWAIRLCMPLAVLVLTLASVRCGRSPQPSGPDVLILVLDALRADHLGLYGYSRDTSPRLDEYARRGVVFDRAYAQASWTFSSTATILTGRYPSDTLIANERTFELSRECETLAEVMKDAGYRTGFFSANPAHKYRTLGDNEPWSTGFEQGFDEYFVDRQPYTNRLRAAALTERALEWIGRGDQRKPFLACVWYIDPHMPYKPPSEFRELFPDSYEGKIDGYRAMRELCATGQSIPEEARQHLINLYDGEIAYADSSIGDMFDTLADKGVLANTLVMVTADHGEAFHEHGQWGHAFSLYEELIRIPLIIAPPQTHARSQPSRNASLVGLIDLMPTILDYVAVPSEKRPAEMQGLSLRPLAEGTDADIDRPAIAAELKYVLRPEGDPQAFTSRALVTERLKLIEIKRPGEPARTLLFDLEQDPLELRSLSDDASSSEQVELLRAQLDLILGAKGESPTRPLPKHVRERLRALGYL